jgi:hypothetical protein
MRLAWEISHGFTSGALDLSARAKAPPVGWQALPETVMVAKLRRRGETAASARRAVTLLAAMDRARDADELWLRAVKLHESAHWTYEIDQVVQRPLWELADALLASGVSQRHLMDSAAWRRIAEALAASTPDRPVLQVIDQGIGSAPHLQVDLKSKMTGGSASYPFLSGPKVGPMWIRMMAVPGEAIIGDLGVIPVAVDVQVRRVTEFLGVTDTEHLDLEQAREPIQNAWRDRVLDEGVDAPGALANTPAGLDPALWFFAKWGCTHCKSRGYRVPIHPVCSECRLPAAPARTPSGKGAAVVSTSPELSDAKSRPLIGLVGCVKTKVDQVSPARDLYVSDLFLGRKAAVEGRADTWFILSAEHGLVEPDERIKPYERALTKASRQERREWAAKVLAALVTKLGDLSKYAFEIHAGADYFAFGLRDGLSRAGAYVAIPTEHLTQGEQLRYYAQLVAGSDQRKRRDPPPPVAIRGRYGQIDRVLLETHGDQVTLTFAEIERLIDGPLPPSARHHNAWWHSRIAGALRVNLR